MKKREGGNLETALLEKRGKLAISGTFSRLPEKGTFKNSVAFFLILKATKVRETTSNPSPPTIPLIAWGQNSQGSTGAT